MNPLKRSYDCTVLYPPYLKIPHLEHYSDLDELDIDDRITELFKRHRDNSDFYSKGDIYQEIEDFLENSSSLNITSSSLSLIETMAAALREVDGYKKVCRKIYDEELSDVKLSFFLQNFSSLKFPENLDEVRSLSYHHIQTHLIASLINRDKLAICDLKLNKDEIKEIGPHLTYLDCRDIFDDSWTVDEIDSFLESCQKIKTLKINSQKIIKLPPLETCEELKCNGCINLKHLPELLLCKRLFCNKTAIRFIPALPFCEVLECYSCENLEQIADLPLCKRLKCNYCMKLTILPSLFNCIKLNCSDTSITHLAHLPLCEELECSGCQHLISIGNLPICKEFDCSECQNLSHLPDLPNCITLNCNACINLIELPNLPVCKTLYCNQCINLTHLSEIPKCKTLYCNECTKLQDLPPLLNCKNLFCSWCVNLTELPRPLRQCRQLSCDNCPSLNINSIPPRLRSQFIKVDLVVEWKAIEDNPLDILLNLSEPLINLKVTPNITFTEEGRKSPGFDQGGLLRVFVAHLMQSLISNSGKPGQLKFGETSSGLAFPVLDKTLEIDVQIKAFQVIGALFELSLRNFLNRESFTIGRCFDRKLFEIIKNLSHEELNDFDINAKQIPENVKLKLMTLFFEPHFKKILKFLSLSPDKMIPEEFNQLRDFVILSSEEKGSDDPFNEAVTQKESLILNLQNAAKQIFLNLFSDAEWLPAIVITKQIHNLLGSYEDLEGLNLEDASVLETKIQGQIDINSFLEALNWETGYCDFSFEQIEKTKGYVKRWIEEANLEDLEKLSSFITGSPTLHPSKKLNLFIYNCSPDRLPTTHTCYFQIELSGNYQTYDQFKEKLKLCLTTVNSSESHGIELT